MVGTNGSRGVKFDSAKIDREDQMVGRGEQERRAAVCYTYGGEMIGIVSYSRVEVERGRCS